MSSSQHTQWFDFLNKLMRGCRGVSQGATINEQKQSFAALSVDLFDALKMLNASPVAVYKLAGSDGRVWLGKSPAAKSPYGNKLGTVQGILKAH